MIDEKELTNANDKFRPKWEEWSFNLDFQHLQKWDQDSF